MSSCCGGTPKDLKAFLFYVAPSSPYQKVNAITKMLIVCVLSSVVFMFDNMAFQVILSVVAVAGLFRTKIPLKVLTMPLLSISGIMVISAVSFALFSKIPGNKIYFTLPWGSYFSENTFFYIVVVYLRLFFVCIVNLIFLSTTRETDLRIAFHTLRVPQTLSFLILLSLRSISILLNDWHNIVQAQQARGMSFKGSLITKARRLEDLLMPMMVTIFERIVQISRSVAVRGFMSSDVKRTQLGTLRWGLADFVLCLCMLPAVYLIVKLRWHL